MQRRQVRSRPILSHAGDEEIGEAGHSFCNIEVPAPIVKKVQDNQTEIIHELYEAHFSRKKATTAVAKRRSNILVEGGQDTIATDDKENSKLVTAHNISRPATSALSKFV